MKKRYTIISLLFLTAATLAFGEGKEPKNWAEEAAKNYENKAALASEAGDAESARIYKRMAQIKRDAGAASNKGKAFDWSEYHALEGELNAKLHKKKDKHKEKEMHGKDHAKQKSREKAHEKEKHKKDKI